MSSSPISSVPEPSSSAGGGLASVITQVSPNAPTSTRNSGPARPQKVKTSTSASKKKKKSSTTTGAGGTTSNTTSAPTGETTTTTEGKEGTGKADDSELEKVANAAKAHANAQAEAQATGSSINPSPAGVVSGLSSQETVTLGDGKAGEKDGANGGNSTTLEQQASSHAADPSSTVVGDVSNATSSSNSANTNKENVTAPVVSNQVPSKSKTSTPAPAIQKNAAKTSSAPQQQAPTSPMKKLIALLTCSSSAGGIVASEKKEDEKEKRNASGTDGAKSNVSGNDSKKVVNEKQNGNATPKVSSIPATNSPSTPSKAKKSKKSSTALAAGAGAGLAAGGLVATSTSSNNLAPPRTPNTPRRSLEGAISGSSTPKRGSMILGGGDDEVSANTTPGGGTRIPREETGDVMSAAVVPPGSSFVSEGDTQDISTSSTGLGVSNLDEDGSEEESDEEEFDEEEDEERRLIMQGGIGIPVDENGNPMPLLSELGKQDTGRKCLVLDLDETLVHSSFKAIQNADFIVPVEIEGTTHSVFVIKRPGVDEFMRKMGEIYEVVVFTASLSKYADPVLDILDIHKVVRHRLFRESCYNHKGNYVKDLSQLGRPISESIIIDNSPASYIFHPNNAVPVSSWFNDPHDTELTDLCPFLSDLATTGDVRAVLDGGL